MTTIGQQIKKARRANDLSARELAQLLGTHQQRVYKWEAGESTPRPETLAEIAKILKVSVTYLQGITERDSSSSVISIMSRLVLKWIHGVATAEEKERLGQLAAQHVGDDLNGSAISCYNSGPASIPPLGDAPDVDVLALRAALGIALAS